MQTAAPPDRWASRPRRAIAFVRQNGIGGSIHKAREYGIANSAFFLKMHMRYQICIELGKRWDKKHNVDTCGQIELDQIEVVGAHKAGGHAIVSTSPRTFAFLARYFPRARENFTYIDVGSGKGRTLLMARRYGFKNIIGIDFAEVACTIARDNLRRFDKGEGPAVPCQVVHADAAQYEYPSGDLVLYFANPFSPDLWRLVIPKIEAALRAQPRKIVLIVAGSVPEKIRAAADLLDRSSFFARRAAGIAPYYLDTYLPFHYAVYEAP